MAFSRGDSPPFTVFSDRPSLSTLPHTQTACTSAPNLRINPSSQQPQPFPNPYEGFELALQRHPLQNKQAPGQPNARQGRQEQHHEQQHGLPQGLSQRYPQQAHGKHRLQQQSLGQPEEASAHRQKRAKTRLPQQMQSPSWQDAQPTDSFPPPVRPASMSPHPDHSLYPSFKFIQPNFGIAHGQAHSSRTPVPHTNQFGSHSTHVIQKEMSPTTNSMTSISSGIRQLAHAQAKSSQPRQQVEGTQSRSLSIRQQMVVTKRLKRAGRTSSIRQPKEPRAPTSVPARSSPKLSVKLPAILASGQFETQPVISMPLPPHPAANFFPFLKPVLAPMLATQGGGQWEPAFTFPVPFFEQQHMPTQTVHVRPAHGVSRLPG